MKTAEQIRDELVKRGVKAPMLDVVVDSNWA
jgi:hypothetical protein